LIHWELSRIRFFTPTSTLVAVLSLARDCFRTRATLQLEVLALRHQLNVLQRSVRRPKLTAADRFLWARLSRFWSGWRSALVMVKPETVIAWHRKGFRLFWTWKVRHGQPGRPPVSQETRKLIRQMSHENPLWGAPRIHGELLKLSIDIGETSVGKYMARGRKPPSQTWRTFLENHIKSMVSVDFFTVPTVRFQVLYVFLVLAHDRRRILHFGVTAHPTAEWTAQQLREAFPWDSAPRFLLRDRDCIFGADFTKQVEACVYRAGDRHDSARVSGPCDRLQRSVIASAYEILPRVLSRDAHSSVPAKGHAGESFGAVAGVRASSSGAAGWRVASSVRTSSRVRRAGNCFFGSVRGVQVVRSV
jgi:hypothetical protein